MRIEYLIIVKQDNTFCNTKEAFLNFLQVDTSITLDGNKIKYAPTNASHQEFVTDFRVETAEITSKNERYFHLTLHSKTKNQSQEFTELADTIREIAQRINPESTRINTLWNDIGREYAIQAYPLINEIENLMRKLISQFMLINVGMDWSKEAIDADIINKIRQRKNGQDTYLDVLYKTDFIHLSDVLFKKYRILKLEELDRILQKGDFSDGTFEKIKTILPKSNWERYFFEKIDYDEDKLKSKWELLYELRNDVAHNRYISHADLGKIQGLAREIKDILLRAINELGNIKLTDEEKENIINSYPNYETSLPPLPVLVNMVRNWYSEKYFGASFKSYASEFNSIPVVMMVEIDPEFRICVDVTTWNSIENDWLRDITDDLLNLVSQERIKEFHLVIVTDDISKSESPAFKEVIQKMEEIKRKTKLTVHIVVGILNKHQFVVLDKLKA